MTVAVFTWVLFAVAMLGLVADIFVLRHAKRLLRANDVRTAQNAKMKLTSIRTSDPAVARAFTEGADVTVDVPSMTMEESARAAIAEIGMTGADAERMFAGIMEGIRKAKESGHDAGTIAISMTPGMSLSPVDVRLMGKQPGHRAGPGRPVAFGGMIEDDDKLVS